MRSTLRYWLDFSGLLSFLSFSRIYVARNNDDDLFDIEIYIEVIGIFFSRYLFTC